MIQWIRNRTTIVLLTILVLIVLYACFHTHFHIDAPILR